MIIDVHVIDPAEVPADILLLDPAERVRSESFRFTEDARHWTACRCALRVTLGRQLSIPPAEVPLRIGAQGKPFLETPHGNIHFNLSHCRDLALIAIASAPVGIDIEARDRATDLLECAESFCHPQEIRELPTEEATRAVALLDIWTAKEAVLKAHGTGLLTPPQEVLLDLSALPGHTRCPAGISDLRIHRLLHPLLGRHSAFLATGDTFPEINYHTDSGPRKMDI